MLALNGYVFFGTSPQFVLIVAGIHTSEQSGVEVAHWIRVKLAARPKPTRYGAIVIPEAFPAYGLDARTAEWRTGSAGKFRNITVGGQEFYPSRHFPPPGQPLAALRRGVLINRDGSDLLIKRSRVQLLPQIEYLIRIVETIQPVRIVSVHGKRPRTTDDLKKARKHGMIDMTDDEITKWDGKQAIAGVNFPGVFVDPRYQPGKGCTGPDLDPCKFDTENDPAFPLLGDPASKHSDTAFSADGKKDDALALATAKAVANRDLVVGNHLGDPVPIVHYAKEEDPNDVSVKGFSLGDWGPVAVAPGAAFGARPGAPVFTIEVKDDNESWAFLDGVQVMKEDGTAPLVQQPTPAERAAGQPGRPYVKPQKFSPQGPQRSKQLQDYAQAIIEVILEKP